MKPITTRQPLWCSTTAIISMLIIAPAAFAAVTDATKSEKSDAPVVQMESSVAAGAADAAEPPSPDAPPKSTSEEKPASGDTQAAPQTEPTEAGHVAEKTEPAPADPGSASPESSAETSPVTTQKEVAAPYEIPEGTGEKESFHRHLFHLSYDMAVPTGDTWENIGAFSPRGMTFEYRFHFTPNIAIGALIGWNKFDIKEKGTFEYDNVTITGTQIRAMDSMHISFAFRYNILPVDSLVVPYLGADTGAYHVWRMTDFGWWNLADTYWHFGFAPGIGAIINLRSLTFLVGSKFHMAVKTQDTPSETYVTFNIGVGFPY